MLSTQKVLDSTVGAGPRRRAPLPPTRVATGGPDRWSGWLHLAQPPDHGPPPSSGAARPRTGDGARASGERSSPRCTTPPAARIGRWLGLAIAVCFVTGVLSHSSSTHRAVSTVLEPSGLGLPGDAGLACGERHRGDPAAVGQAVGRVSAAVVVAPAALGAPCAGAALGPGPGRRGCLPALHRTAQHRPVVPVAVLLPTRHFAVAWLLFGALSCTSRSSTRSSRRRSPGTRSRRRTA